MANRTVIALSEGPSTRLGRLLLAGEVIDDEPIMPSTLRVMDAYVLSVVLDGEGAYRDADGREERIVAGAHTIVPPGIPHWYGTDPGHRWTELFAVFAGPLFDSLAELGILAAAGPRYPRPIPSIEALRAVLRTPPSSQRAAEHQLLALADWLLDTQDAGEQQPDLDHHPRCRQSRRATVRRPHRRRRPADRRRRVGPQLRHVPAPLHRAGRPVAVGVSHRASTPDGRHPAPAHRHDPSRDRPDPGVRRRVPFLPAVPRPVRRLAARLPPLCPDQLSQSEELVGCPLRTAGGTGRR